MDDKGFISFSLESLGKMGLLTEDEYRAYRGFYLAEIESESDKQFEIFRYPCRVNAYVIILCMVGSIDVVSNLRQYKIERNCLFVSTPKDIIHITEWRRCRLFIIAFDDDFIRRSNMNYNNAISVMLGIQRQPCVKLKKDDALSLQETFLSLNRDIEAFRDRNYNNDVIMSYINLITYKGLSYISHYFENLSDETEPVNRRSEEFYNKFMTLLTLHFKQERNISFYASKLYITPKYMTSIIKKTSGRSAMDWINDYVVMEAKNLLKYSEMSVQDISEYLNFTNQSHFAQYFRRLTGSSPSEYRDKE